jgi:hypothetical protein
MGTMEKVMSAGTRARYGASLKTKRSAWLGDQVLFEDQLESVGHGLESPKGPQRWGPMRLCMSEMALRSNQIIKVTAPINAPKPTRTLITTISRITQIEAPWYEERVDGGEQAHAVSNRTWEMTPERQRWGPHRRRCRVDRPEDDLQHAARHAVI